jgi:hypothetical protein
MIRLKVEEERASEHPIERPKVKVAKDGPDDDSLPLDDLSVPRAKDVERLEDKLTRRYGKGRKEGRPNSASALVRTKGRLAS